MESVIGSMSPTIVEKIVIASRIVTPEKWLQETIKTEARARNTNNFLPDKASFAES